jgi:hypothetical protein
MAKGILMFIQTFTAFHSLPITAKIRQCLALHTNYISNGKK